MLFSAVHERYLPLAHGLIVQVSAAHLRARVPNPCRNNHEKNEVQSSALEPYRNTTANSIPTLLIHPVSRVVPLY